MADFYQLNDHSLIQSLIEDWRKSLIIPQDGMWEAFSRLSDHWKISEGERDIGFAVIHSKFGLIQFFLDKLWLADSTSIFQEFLRHTETRAAVIGTNDPIFYSIATRIQTPTNIHTLLYQNMIETEAPLTNHAFEMASQKNHSELVEFYHKSTGAPVEWLKMYTEPLVEAGEIFVLSTNKEILGVSEIRTRESDLSIADVGMVVAPLHRKKGIGTLLLGKAKEIAIARNLTPICSTEIGNTGSIKAIERNGFRSIHQMHSFTF